MIQTFKDYKTKGSLKHHMEGVLKDRGLPRDTFFVLTNTRSIIPPQIAHKIAQDVIDRSHMRVIITYGTTVPTDELWIAHPDEADMHVFKAGLPALVH